MPVKKMNPEIKAEWLKALRSDEFKQGMGYLNYGNEFCCLGILCELSIRKNLDVEKTYVSRTNITKYGGRVNMPPGNVVEWAGMDVGQVNFLANLNDKGWSFKRIAAYIERYM